MNEIEFINCFKKSNPTKFHNFSSEYFRACNGPRSLNASVNEGFEKEFQKYLTTRKKQGDFHPTMQSWHKYLRGKGLDNRPPVIR
ncbi:hypothetical protein [Neobacillus mesonae]|uniref:Uncharacterized protein n=1 Tax=Neobacillus mesonae TaxID=1193713 RepID=A0A3Q9QXF9_9BACI|nr:hypothetical protein [Neobacillus mesonae]AZU62569.1 hypothetical protein CHR53_15555 [Neobacillus mesonae]